LFRQLAEKFFERSIRMSLHWDVVGSFAP